MIGAAAKILRHLADLSTCGFPQEGRWARDDTGFVQVRRAARRATLVRYPRILHPVLNLWRVLSWPVHMIATTMFASDMGLRDKIRAIGRGYHMNAHPLEVSAVHDARGSIFSSDMIGFYNWLGPRDAPEWVQDKWAFAEFCRATGLPHPVTQIGSLYDQKDWVGVDRVVIKPRFGSGGAGLQYVSKSELDARAFRLNDLDLVQEYVGRGGDTPKYLRLVTIAGSQAELMVAFDEESQIVDAAELGGLAALCLKVHDQNRALRLLAWDVLYDGSDYTVLEVNRRVSLLHLEDVMGQPIRDTALGRMLQESV